MDSFTSPPIRSTAWAILRLCHTLVWEIPDTVNEAAKLVCVRAILAKDVALNARFQCEASPTPPRDAVAAFPPCFSCTTCVLR
jgi:hypothetical protein